jgi:SAM-dependent methyltransferase
VSLKQNISYYLRKTGLLGVSDKLRYWGQKMYYAGANKNFIKTNTSVKFPPPYFIYETYRLDYAEYYNDGLATAGELVDMIKRNTLLSKDDRLLDWGCGPARIVRHFPLLLPANKIYATDYNPDYIDWAQKNIPGVSFSVNKLLPPLQYEDGFFSAITGLSIFTHLSAKAHEEWMKELYRVIRKEGILLITTQGLGYRNILLPHEQDEFDAGRIVIRENFKQGHRLYSAFQPPGIIKELIRDKFDIAEYIEGVKESVQDIWVLKKQ